MTNSSEISELESWHLAYDVFIYTVEALASPPEKQIEMMGDYNIAWELRDDALCGRYLLGRGRFTAAQEAQILAFFAAVDPIPVNDMRGGGGVTSNLADMRDPAWEPIRPLAKSLLDALSPVTLENQRYLGRFPDAP